MKLWSAILVGVLMLSSQAALAKRLGGGVSIGQQSAKVAQRNAAAGPAPAPAVPAKPVAASLLRRPWGAMLGGLAAGLGLAWLASEPGFGAALAQCLALALLGVLAAVAVGGLLRTLKGAAHAGQHDAGRAYATAGGVPRDYSPKNVGNDASARPWEQPGGVFDAAGLGGTVAGAMPAGWQGWGVPADFDAEGFLSASKTNFVQLQAAWDRADIPALRAMMTDEMIDQIQAQLAERERQAGLAASQTEVVMLDAKLLGIEDLPGDYLASVEFSGLIREEAAAGPSPFREVWNITRPKTGPGGWLVAGVQALQ